MAFFLLQKTIKLLISKKITEFEDPPEIPILNVPISHQPADESFTVYDHPEIIIFKKTR